MNYIPGEKLEVLNERYSSLGFSPGVFIIQNIRLDRETQEIVYRFTNGKTIKFKSIQEAEAIFDRIKGVVREMTTPLGGDGY